MVATADNPRKRGMRDRGGRLGAAAMTSVGSGGGREESVSVVCSGRGRRKLGGAAKAMAMDAAMGSAGDGCSVYGRGEVADQR